MIAREAQDCGLQGVPSHPIGDLGCAGCITLNNEVAPLVQCAGRSWIDGVM